MGAISSLDPQTRRFEMLDAYSPDGRHIMSGSVDKTIRMWDAKTGSAVGKPFEGHTGSVWSVAYSPDGRYIISGSADKYGMRRLDHMNVYACSGILIALISFGSTLLTLLMGAASSPDPRKRQFEYGF